MKSFVASQVQRTHTIRLNGTLETVFPLFSPDAERDWVDGWDYDAVYPLPFKLAKNSVFTTETHDHTQQGALWIVSRYAPQDYSVEFYRIEPNNKVGHIEIHCSALPQNRSDARITYTYVALSEAGNQFIKGYTEEHFRDYIGFWQAAINHYLATGQALPAH